MEEEVHSICKRNRPVFDSCVVEKGHGRIETRRCKVFEKGLIVDFENRWKNLNSVIKITSIREFTNKTETQVRFYISSLSTKNDFNKYIRDHWSVENNLHWILDIPELMKGLGKGISSFKQGIKEVETDINEAVKDKENEGK